jgi:extracellular factor (EF) 3-hydroxypalmitic acid methyl ester biosynthesis protein
MATQNGEHASGRNLRDTLVTGQTSNGVRIHATPLRLTRISAVLELYDTSLILRSSEVINEVKVVLRDRPIYLGRAVVRNIVNAGPVVICEMALNEGGWIEVDINPKTLENGDFQKEFNGFVSEWPKLNRITPEFKVVVADMHNFLADMRLWLEQVELNVRSQPSKNRYEYERSILGGLNDSALSTLGLLFERFENTAAGVEEDLRPAHGLYAKRQLHPSVLCSPFMYRTFHKPLGYAGDYEMVNMMASDPYQGGSMFAKVLNSFFLSTPPVVAHRNRIERLTQLLSAETERAKRANRRAKIFNMGCGPGLEIQAFIKQSSPMLEADFTLLDFNDETISHTQQTLNSLQSRYQQRMQVQMMKRSVHQLLKEYTKPVPSFGRGSYDIVYCAGLFDYLSNPVCKKLMQIFYDLAAPGGLVVATNVATYNPSRGWMELVVDWHLFHRDSAEVAALAPPNLPEDATHIVTDPSGVNVFLEIRKPKDA